MNPEEFLIREEEWLNSENINNSNILRLGSAFNSSNDMNFDLNDASLNRPNRNLLSLRVIYVG